MNKEELHIYDGDKPYLFISYSHADEKVVFPLLQGIQEAGYRFWLDRGIEVGTEWSNNIADRLSRCGAVIFFVSKKSVLSENCLDEIACAKSHKKPAVLIYLEEDVVLPGGVEMQTARFQRMYATRHSSIESFVGALNTAPMLEPCREVPPAAPAEDAVTETPVAPAAPTRFCSGCGAGIYADSKFCNGCGRPVQTATPMPVGAKSKSPMSNKKKILLAVIAVAAVVAIVIGIVAISAHANRVYTVDEVADAFSEAGYLMIAEEVTEDMVPEGMEFVETVLGYAGTRTVGGCTDEVFLIYFQCADETDAENLYRMVTEVAPEGLEESKYDGKGVRATYREETYGECSMVSQHGNKILWTVVDWSDYLYDGVAYDHLPESVLEEVNF